MKNQKHCKGSSKRHLPSDLLTEILCRLPVKSLLRFRSVSKSWLALVDHDQDFARLHLETFKNNTDETHLFLDQTGFDCELLACSVRSSDTFETISEMPLRIKKYGWIVSSIDGVVLIRHSGYGESAYKLWNPSLRRSFDVEPLPFIGHYSEWLDIGFGYDPTSKDYKIVTLISNHLSMGVVRYSVGIYTVGVGSWKITPLPEWHDYSIYTNEVYLQGNLYMFARRDEYDLTTWDLLSFDLSNEVFSSVCRFDEAYSCLMGGDKLVLIDGRFYVPMLDKKSGENSVWVLEMKTMGWTKYCSYTSKNIRILYVKKNGDLLASKGHCSDINGEKKCLLTYELVSYIPEKCEYKILHEQRSFGPSRFVRVFAYVESLILHQCNMNRKKDV